MSEDQAAQTPKAKGEPLIRCCAACGVQFENLVDTNTWLKCPVCENEFLVRIKPVTNQD